MNEIPDRGGKRLLVILIAAVFQGWALYGLHWSIKHGHWPATDGGWLIALYALSVFMPLSIQLTAEHARQRALWLVAAVLGLAFFYFGWHIGSALADDSPETPVFDLRSPAPLGAVPVLLLMLLPFLQARLSNGTWRSSYGDYFGSAWHNMLRLAEAALFTGVLWLLLELWAYLFKLLRIDFFDELFTEPVFVYPVSAIAFGIALHLIGSQQRLVGVVLEQLLGLLKWLALITGLILLLFTLTLLPQLPALFADGRRALSALWLLWLVAVMVLLLNAAYRDGSAERPYPRAIALALRVVVPLMLVVASVALYALARRIAEFGLTLERTWGLLVALAAVAYSAGYAFAALRPGRWMGSMGRVNVGVALGLIALLGMMLTPVLSPWRLAAASQYRRALAADNDSRAEESIKYLRWQAGRYGEMRLAALASLTDHPRAMQLQRVAARVRAMEHEWDLVPMDSNTVLAALPVYPSGRIMDEALRKHLVSLATEGTDPGSKAITLCQGDGSDCAGLYLDLDADGREEFLLLSPWTAQVHKLETSSWRYVASTRFDARTTSKDLFAALRRGDFSAQPPRWQDLRIGKQVIDLSSTPFTDEAAAGITE